MEMQSVFKQGSIYETSVLTNEGITVKLKKKFAYQVLLLDTIDTTKSEYQTSDAVNRMNSIGWVSLDDVTEVLGGKLAQKVIKFCEERNKKAIEALEAQNV